MPAVQKRAFPLAGLMCTLRGIAHAHEGRPGMPGYGYLSGWYRRAITLYGG